MIGHRPARLLMVCLAAAAGGCENGVQDMYHQPKYQPLAPAPLWSDGRSARPLEPGTVAHSAGTQAGTSSGRGGLLAEPADHASYTAGALARGRERYDIYCAPCHGVSGDGNGYITERGFPRPPSYHNERLRAVSDAYLYAVITSGYGSMYPYAERVTPEDRWAIVAYIRALQVSQHVRLAELPRGEQAHFSAPP